MAKPARKHKPTAPRRVPKSSFGAQTVDAILGATARILEQHGPDRLTTNRVAELAGVSIGSLYQYFPNKESLYGALQDRYAEDTLSRIRGALEGADRVPIQTVITRVAVAVLAAKQAQRPIHRWLIDWRSLSTSAERYRQRLDAQVELIAAFLASRDDVSIADVRATAFVLVHSIEGLIEAVTERPHIDAAGVVPTAMAMVTAFLGTVAS